VRRQVGRVGHAGILRGGGGRGRGGREEVVGGVLGVRVVGGVHHLSHLLLLLLGFSVEENVVMIMLCMSRKKPCHIKMSLI
jgi:hypothetical protein